MSEWWTYTLSDFLMFSPRTYYRLFELYNLAVWPAHLLALAGAAAVLGAPWRRAPWAGRLVAAILVAAWAWIAGAYLLTRYDDINWAARYYAIGFAVQAVLLGWSGIIRDRSAVHWSAGFAPRVGLAFFLLGVVAYPLLAPLLGRPWTQAEVFAIAPDPTIMATLGVLLAAERRSGILLVIPLLWCAVSGATLWTMDAPEWFVMPAAASVTIVLAARRACGDR
jgi:Family of unknown function (DUF6064)